MAMIFSRIVIKTSEFNEEGGIQRKPIASPPPNIIQPKVPESVVKQQVFGAEFLGALIFYIAWIVVRNTTLSSKGSLIDQYMSLIKPLFVTFGWAASRILFVDLMGAGIANPTLVFGVWILDLAVYNPLTYRKTPNAQPVRVYQDDDMGNWVWIYFISSILAAPVAGYIAKQLLSVLNQNSELEKSMREDDNSLRQSINDKEFKQPEIVGDNIE